MADISLCFVQIWGDHSYLYKNRTFPGSVAQFQRHYKQVVAPDVITFIKKVIDCAELRCNRHGRCTTLDDV